MTYEGVISETTSLMRYLIEIFLFIYITQNKTKKRLRFIKTKISTIKVYKNKKNNLHRIFLRSLNEKNINPPTLSTYWCRTEIENSVK